MARLSELLPKILLLVTLSIAMVVSIAWGLADRYALNNRSIMLDWKSSISASSWQQALSEIDTALWLNNDHGVYHYRRARLYHFCVLYLVDCDLEKKQAAEVAKHHYRQAIAIRPYWAEGQARLAIFKRDIGELDSEFHKLVSTAMSQGSWDPAVQTLIAKISLSHWSVFSEDERASLTDNIVRGVRNPSRRASTRVVGLIKEKASTIDDAIVGKLAQMLVDETWNNSFVELAFMFWTRWSTDNRRAIIIALNDFTDKRVNKVLTIARNYRKLPIACAVLVQTKAVLRACHDRRILGSIKK